MAQRGETLAAAAPPAFVPRLGARRDWLRFLFIGPAAVWVIAITLFPLGYAIFTSLYSFRYGTRFKFIGTDNFERLLHDGALHSDLVITLVFVAAAVPIELVLGLALALLFNRQMRAQGLFRAILTLPLFATPVAVGYLAITLYYETNGPINNFLRALGLHGVPWLSDPHWALVSVILVDIWQWTPFVFLVTLAALQGLSKELYEAAAVDGAGARQMFRTITLPLMTPILTLVLLLRTVEAFKIFDIPISLTLGGPGHSTEVYSLYTYRTSQQFFDYGYAAAQALLLLLIVMTIVSLLFGRLKRIYQ